MSIHSIDTCHTTAQIANQLDCIPNTLCATTSNSPNDYLATIYPSDFISNRANILSGDSDRMSVQRLNGGVFRPRGALARTLYDKHQNDCKLREVNKMEWYRCNLDGMDEDIGTRFHQLEPDEDTRAFIANSIDKSSWLWTQIWYSLMMNILRLFMTKTDINGWLGRGSMFVLSLKQLSNLMDVADVQRGVTSSISCMENDVCINTENFNFMEEPIYRKIDSLIDIGAGDGEVTIRWSPLFHRVYATEISSSMRKLLSTKGFDVLDAHRWSTEKKFSVISMLNLLDRCAEPHSMLLTARQALKDDGLIIIALVLPFKPYVEYTDNHSPLERLPITGKTFEEQVESFIQYVRADIGLEIVVWSRVPYLCEGDLSQSYYWLDDAVFVFKKMPQI